MSNIITQMNYLCPSRYISGRIIEYDIKAANINCLRSSGVISEDDYIYLSNLPKQQREVEIGLREKEDPKLYTIIQTKIKEAKQFLYEANNIEDDQIVRVANDAVYINRPDTLQNIQYDNYIRFVPKTESNIMVIINKVVIFLKYLDNGYVDIDVKGISENNLKKHANHMLATLYSLILTKERAGIRDALSYLSGFVEDYLNMRLPAEYYREFNADSRFRVKTLNINNAEVGIDNLLYDTDKYCLDINYNLSILRELWSIFIEQYNMSQ